MLDVRSTAEVSSYQDIFELRGRLYHEAMQRFPDARAQEFRNVIAQAELGSDMTIVDVPSGGAYISRYIADAQLIGLEMSSSFAESAASSNENVLLYQDDQFPLRAESADRVLSIAGLHHVEDKKPIFAEMRRITKPDGLVVIADVAQGSRVRSFLDDFVGKYSETGHSGWYFGDSTRAELAAVGLDIVADEPLNFLWCAADLHQLAEFCKLLFGMTLADTDTVAQGLVERLGVQDLDDQQVGVNWQLHCFTCKTQPTTVNAL